ncbi:MAG: hypothetical protein O7E52_17865 [Candidatus Poribacteria bacterium]|nr:hypothetical protein [Candidatus Poribacteria bacterium]
MPRRYTYIATCIKETPIRWGIELESSGDPIPPRVVQFPNLTQPLTTSPYLQSGYDPVTYFGRLVKGVPEMLRGYNTRILKQIQRKLDRLQVGDCCHVKVSYIDNGEAVIPYNYSFEVLEDPPRESQQDVSRETDREEAYLPSAAPSIDGLSAPAIAELGAEWQESNRSREAEEAESPICEDADPLALIVGLHDEIRKLQTDMDLIKEWLAETGTPSYRRRTQVRRTVEAERPTADTEGSRADSSRPTEVGDRRREVTLDLDEQSAIEHIMRYRTATESQLSGACQLAHPAAVMAGLIEKMMQSNFPWISVEEGDNGELIYIWNPPDERAR